MTRFSEFHLTPTEELKALVEKVAELALDEVDKYGAHRPLACASSPEGEPYIFLSRDLEGEDVVDMDAEYESIDYQLRQFIAEGKIVALALAKNVHIRIETDEGSIPATAVQMAVDHQDMMGYMAFLTYHMEDGKAVPEHIYYEELTERFFDEVS